MSDRMLEGMKATRGTVNPVYVRAVVEAGCRIIRDGSETHDAAGKPCPLCREPMSNLTSQYRRVCTNGKCGHVEHWPLNPGQKPLFGNNRV